MTAELSEVNEVVAELNAVAAELPPERLRQVLNYARMLKYSQTGEIEMGELTADDKRAIAHAALRRFDEEHPGEDWGDLKPMKPGDSLAVALTVKSKALRNPQMGEVRWGVVVTNQNGETTATYDLLTMNAV